MNNQHRASDNPPIRNSDIHCLGVFRSVVECKGVSMAAIKLNVDVSTVSRQLKDLETRLDLRLCERGRSGFSLTTEGESVFRLTCDLLLSIEDFEDRIDEIRGRAGGQLRIGAINHVRTNNKIGFGQVIRRINEKAPELEVGYNVMSQSEICRAVLNGHIHIGITAHDRVHPELDRLVIYTEEHHLFCSRGHPLYEMSETQLKLSSLHKQKYVGRERSSLLNDVAESLGLIRGAAANNVEAITVLVESGLYLGYLPAHHVAALSNKRDFRAINIQRTIINVPLFLYHRKGARRFSPVRMFINEIKAVKT
jgi:DNA-binding transcriptional LysR family regulator